MYNQLILFFIILIVAAFSYLHMVNPTEVSFFVTDEYTFIIPVTILLLAGFLTGLGLAGTHSLFVELKRSIREMKLKREKKRLEAAEGHFREGVEAIYKGKPALARTLIEKAQAVHPSTDMTLRLAETYAVEERYAEAVGVLDKKLSETPGSIELLTSIASTAEAGGDTQKAASVLKEILKIDPGNPVSLRRLRDIRVKDHKWDAAADLQRRIVGLEKKASYDRGPEALARERRRLSGFIFEAALECVETGKYDEGISKLKEVLKKDEGFVPAHVLVGEALYKQGRLDRAATAWENAYEKHGDIVFLLKLEEAYIEKSEPSKIIDVYKKALRANPRDADLRLVLSRLFLRLEMVDEATEELEKLQDEDEGSFYGSLLLAEAYSKHGQNDKSTESLRRAFGLDKGLYISFDCSSCGHKELEWVPRCPSCNEWSTLALSKSPVALKNPDESGE